ncbi:sporulation protein [Streptomyces sp. AP-93]|uniref:sporulation protein n=1 Tax=Streptomyces sp. AP-93 TaxID=2929048 RepID=UPI001FB00B38|nr:sporulation protein [Streptomyces sp. AP-93]MCJ0868016.1 sporulation protein [Streptomyces sp. AP-93]
MARTKDRQGDPNENLARLVKQAGASHKSLAAQVNRIGAAAGVPLRYEHTSVARWVNLGMIPRGRVPEFLAAALGERLGRHVSVDEIGMYSRSGGNPDMGLDFARDPVDAIRVAATYWRTVDRSRRQLISNGFAIAAFATPVTRWLAKPTDAPVAHEGGRQVGRSDLDELWRAADEARLWDSRFGGGNWKASSVTECLRLSAAPLLTGTYTEAIGRELFAATAELSRVVGWSAVDTGHHDIAQRHFVQALRLARAAGNVESGCYVLATMALQAFLRGCPEQAADMAEGAYERGLGHAAPRVLAFAKLAEARAHGRTGNARAAKAALGRTQELLDSIRPGSHDPEQLAYMTHARLAADATEVHRDLADPKGAFAWNGLAEPMPADRFTRATGIRMAVLATSHLQNRELEPGLTAANTSLTILSNVQSARAHSYLHEVTRTLSPWKDRPEVADLIQRTRTELPAAA